MLLRSILRSLSRLGLALGMLLVLALPAGADIYHVKLSSGTVIDTRYQPQDASWDKSMVLLLTEVGNWVGVRKDEIESVTAENATRGFGVTIRNNTISPGFAPNDQPNPNGDKGAAALDRLTQAIQGLSQSQQQKPYTIQQGVSSEQTQGIRLASSTRMRAAAACAGGDPGAFPRRIGIGGSGSPDSAELAVERPAGAQGHDSPRLLATVLPNARRWPVEILWSARPGASSSPLLFRPPLRSRGLPDPARGGPHATAYRRPRPQPHRDSFRPRSRPPRGRSGRLLAFPPGGALPAAPAEPVRPQSRTDRGSPSRPRGAPPQRARPGREPQGWGSPRSSSALRAWPMPSTA